MGKSTTAQMFAALGIPVHDSDRAVHTLYQCVAVPVIARAFPSAVENGIVNRAALAHQVRGNDAALAQLESLIHPLVRAHRADFLRVLPATTKLIVYDIPLLFETNEERNCDAVLLVTARAATQQARVLARPGMDLQRFQAILKRQMRDADKRQRAHFILSTDKTPTKTCAGGLAYMRQCVEELVELLTQA